ncbi:MAG TPA: ATP-binding protein, partial [Bdellovibrionales bacterium]|nr:ATP-binding protein [Bdellovibrionales bacterium]
QEFRQNYQRLVASEANLRQLHNELEQRVNERTQEVLHLQKMEAIGSLAGGLAHEMNNVLQGVLLSTALLEKSAGGDSEMQKRVLTINKYAMRGKQLLQQMLAFSRKGSVNLQNLEFQSCIREALAMLRSTLPENIELVEIFDERAESSIIQGDLTQIQQAMVNLCANAAYAMKERGGKIVVETGLLPERENVFVRVSDTGVGIHADAKDKIFEPFFTTKPVGEGTGMGLAVVHGIVKLHRGQISHSSEVGVGTAFTLSFPIECKNSETEERSVKPPIGGTERILVIDDEVDLAELLSDTLANLGYRVDTFSDPEVALSAYRQNPSDFDLIFTDFRMPGMNGIELSERMSAIRPVPTLICSAYADSTAQTSNKHMWLQKPLDTLLLDRAIRTALDEQT